MSQYAVTWRDEVAYWLTRASLRIATKEYRAFVTLTFQRGAQVLADDLAHAAHRDGQDGADPQTGAST